jgi:hypothetical protein
MRPTRLTAVAAVALALVAAPHGDAAVPRLQTSGLQVALKARGLYRGPIDAIAGPGTIRAVVRFQRRRDLDVDGIAGPQTRRALGRLGRPLYGRRPLRRGISPPPKAARRRPSADFEGHAQQVLVVAARPGERAGPGSGETGPARPAEGAIRLRR